MSLLSNFLLTGTMLLLFISIAQWLRGRPAAALAWLMGSAFLLRLLVAGLDPFLHDWDERFHALVARNLMAEPFRPLLRANAVLAYDYQAWCCNHVWLHKQPLFLWQMALSMKLFGINMLALRLPSVLLGTLLLYPIYRIGRLAYNDANTGYLAALLAAFAYYALEQTTGLMGMDHDDVAFMAYVAGSVWAYYEYRASARPTRWLVAAGVLAGAAVLCKWLTGLVVYGAWGLDIVRDAERRRHLAEYGRALASGLVAVAVALPWQLYTAWRFPLESSHERAYNTRHFSEALEGHAHSWDYYFRLLPVHYGLIGLLIAAALLLALRPSERPQRLVPLLAVVAAIYCFFTLAATKLPSYTYVVSPLLLVLAARPLALAIARLRNPGGGRWGRVALLVLLLAVVLADARPWGIVAVHLQEGTYGLFTTPIHRATRTANARLYEQLAQEVAPGTVVFNAPAGDEVQVMFHSGLAVYGWAPPEAEIQRLVAAGYRLAAFPPHHGQPLPAYLSATPGFQLIWGVPE